MSGSLVLIQETTVSSGVSSVSLTGINSTYDVYKVVISGVKVSSDDAISIRVTKSGSADTSANYDEAKLYLKSDGSSAQLANENQTQIDFTATVDSGVAASNANGVGYLFNFPNSSEYSYVSLESAHFQYNDDTARGFYGGFVHTVASASDGVLFKTNTGQNNTAGTFKLYGINK